MSPARRALALSLAVAGAVAACAAWLAPASLVDARLSEMTGGAVRLVESDGTLWHAKGALQVAGTRVPVAWRMEAWPLLRGAFHVQLVRDPASNAAAPRGDVVVDGHRVLLRDVDATLPAALFSTSPRAFWTASGTVHVASQSLVWAPPDSTGAARLDWKDARLTTINGQAALDLGDVTLGLKAARDELAGPVSNSGGEVEVSGDIAYRPTEYAEISVRLVPRRRDQRELAQTLALIGTPEGGGWRVRWRQPLR